MDTVLSLLSAPQPSHRDLSTVPLNTVDLDWDALRLMVRAKMFRDEVNKAALAKLIAVSDTALGRFLRGGGKQLEVRSVLRLMVWLGWTDLVDFIKED